MPSTQNPNIQTLTRADISDAVYHEIGLSKSDSDKMVQDVFDHISNALVAGNNVKLTNFGSFKLSLKKERVARNPKTGETAIVSARRVLTFKPAAQMIDRVTHALAKKKISKT